ncbi:MAG: phosphohistidine phosphatase SixA [Planctomycetota bacterium]|nr:MAG: phosphohistidine phosphatase SixA [Planctomycetota bacterium]
MRLYLVRHGEAVAQQLDPQRPLSEAGRAAVRRLARALRAAAAVRAPGEVWHSSKLRAHQTAEELLAGLGLQAPLRQVAELEPGADPGALLAALAAERSDLVLVGHLPSLAELAALLVLGRAEAGAFVLQPATVLCLEREPGQQRCAVRWMVEPGLFGGG